MKSSISNVESEWAKSTFSDYPDARRQLSAFETHKSTVKREWVTEKRELETVCFNMIRQSGIFNKSQLFGNIQTKLKTYSMKPFVPAAGLTPSVLLCSTAARGHSKSHLGH